MPTTRQSRPLARPLPRFGQTLRCPDCGHFISVGVLSDGRKLRCTACGDEVMLVREYHPLSGEQQWELRSADDEYEEEERR
jgi:uncharacterized paraquat-inducible protein A